ncbi:hypothetical protein CYY_003468 [Polysphondylium violaceum]|uniref:Transmembrane protein n=1 Tax=Polysphondylium violaceum TaxID=133409 RepID=A0A8J4PWR2_9MYCE|nr:hypothetical protein CYY_003468 [Polysphondylium violaceum]
MSKSLIGYSTLSSLIALFFFLIFYYLYVNPALKVKNNYTSYNCTVTDVTSMKLASGFSYKYMPIVSTIYTIDTASYAALCNENIFLIKSSTKKEKVDNYLSGFSIGAATECFIDPDQSDHCVLSTKVPIANILITSIIPGFFALVALVGFSLAFFFYIKAQALKLTN